LIRAPDIAAGLIMLVGLAVLLFCFGRMVVFQLVQVVRFDSGQVELIYRWPWLNKTIPYRSIQQVELSGAPPALMLPGSHPRHGIPVKIVISTRYRRYEIDSGSAALRSKAKAIYDELQRHSAEFAGLPPSPD
jgi:hypothetical protein